MCPKVQLAPGFAQVIFYKSSLNTLLQMSVKQVFMKGLKCQTKQLLKPMIRSRHMSVDSSATILRIASNGPLPGQPVPSLMKLFLLKMQQIPSDMQ